MIVSTLTHVRTQTIMHYHQLLCTLDMFKFDMIVDDSFCCLKDRMIVNDGLFSQHFCQKGLKHKWQMVN